MTSVLGEMKKDLPSVLDSSAGPLGLPLVPGVCCSCDRSAVPWVATVPCAGLLVLLFCGPLRAVVNVCPLNGWLSLRGLL